MIKGLFIGLSTLDFIYLSAKFPNSNQKIVALDQIIVAGGPATNAAITFNYFGNQSLLLTVLGKHPLSNLIRIDLESLELLDLFPDYLESPAVSSIIVSQATGERAVISLNASKFQVNLDYLPPHILSDIDIVLIDGHQMLISKMIAKKARSNNIPVVIDGGSWKQGFEEVLPYVNYAICSGNFYPPGCYNSEDVISYLHKMGIIYIAITQGENPIIYSAENTRGKIEVNKIKAVDTLGAGDIFHGAFCHYILNNNFYDSLSLASQISTQSCVFFGPRQWMKK